MAFAAGQSLTAELLNDTFPASESDTQNTQGTTTSTTYTATLTSGTACGLVFTAPLSGVVLVHNSALCDNSGTTPRSYCTFQIRAGGTIGSGAIQTTAADANAIHVLGTGDATLGRTIRITGLTAGDTYNIQQLFRVDSASTGTYINKHLVVQPVIRPRWS